MKKIFILDSVCSINAKVEIKDDDFHHLSHVLRIKKNDSFIIGDKNNNEYYGSVENIHKNKIDILIKDKHQRKKLKIPEIICFFSLLKGDKNEVIIQKCTEIGVTKFYPVITKNTIVKIRDNKEKKIKRFKKIAREAAMQSCAVKIPEIFEIIYFDELEKYDIKGVKIFGYIKEKQKTLNHILNNANGLDIINFMIGPEGDFENYEIDKLIKLGWEGINLSENILKSETSAIFLSSIIYSYFYN